MLSAKEDKGRVLTTAQRSKAFDCYSAGLPTSFMTASGHQQTKPCVLEYAHFIQSNQLEPYYFNFMNKKYQRTLAPQSSQ